MGYDVDHDFDFQKDEGGVPYLPDGVTEDGNLLVLPNGKYLPRGYYRTEDGGGLIYEPPQLSSWADMLAACTEE